MRCSTTVMMCVLILMWASSACAQTPINAPGAMQPSTGTGVWHIMAMYRQIGSDPASDVERGRETILLSQAAYGLRKDLMIQFDVPMVYRDLVLEPGSTDDDSEIGVGDMTALLKYRIYQHDSGPTETMRFSLIGGLQIPAPGSGTGFTMDSSNDAWDPIVGGVFSTVQGRHGFNADLLYEFYTGDDADDPENGSDSLRYDGSYLYRLWPEQYASDSASALYAVAELNGFYDTNGDHEIFLSPGLMYEARSFTVDATVMLPVHQEVDHRSETEFLVGIGVRLSF